MCSKLHWLWKSLQKLRSEKPGLVRIPSSSRKEEILQKSFENFIYNFSALRYPLSRGLRPMAPRRH